MAILRWLKRRIGIRDSMTNIVRGNPAPAFELKSVDGKSFALKSALEKGPVVAAFFKISCPVCQFTFPFLERLHQRYGKDVTFLGISQNDAKETQKFIEQYGVRFPVLLDEAGYPVSNEYGLTSVPTVFLINSDRKVVVSSMGFDKSDLETIADALADHGKAARAPVFLPHESVPAHKPG